MRMQGAESPSLDARLHHLAATQYGVVTRSDLVHLGFSRTAISRRVQKGLLVRVYPATFRIAGVATSWMQSLYAACRWIDGNVVVSHRSAARLWGLGDTGGF